MHNHIHKRTPLHCNTQVIEIMAQGILQACDFHLKATEDRPSALIAEIENIPHKFVSTHEGTQKLKDLEIIFWPFQKRTQASAMNMDRDVNIYVKNKPINGLDRPRWSQEVKVHRFRDKGTGFWQVVSLTHRPPLPPRKCSWYSFLLEAESTPRPQCDRKDFMSLKNPLTPAGNEPATFRIVAQHLNHCATAVPQYRYIN